MKDILLSEKVEECLLYEAYKAFYGKGPDFKELNRNNITVEMQAMVYLLEQYGIVIGDYRFSYKELSHLNMPISYEIARCISWQNVKSSK